MTIQFRALLIVGALFTLIFFLRKIRKCELEIDDSIFWFLFAFLLLLLAVLPGILFFFTSLLGVESPANLLFLLVIAILLVREFSLTIQLSRLKNKLRTLVQEDALEDADE